MVSATLAGGFPVIVFETFLDRTKLDPPAADEAGGAGDTGAGNAIGTANTSDAANSVKVRLAIQVRKMPVE
jgi:hypothetical protein